MIISYQNYYARRGIANLLDVIIYCVTNWYACISVRANEPPRDKTSKMACAPSEHLDRPGHPPSLIRVFAVRMKKARVLSYPLSAQRILWSDWVDAQADLNLRLAHIPLCWFCRKAAQIIATSKFKPSLLGSLSSDPWYICWCWWCISHSYITNNVQS